MIYDEKNVRDQRVLDVIELLSSDPEVGIDFEDDRTDEQKKTHKVLVVATDKFLSGWGRAENGSSCCAWACEPHQVEKIYRWVCSRSDMHNVQKVKGDWNVRDYNPSCVHAHVYVVTDNHPAVDGTYNVD